uniref:chromatin assembly factor 1 subunit A-B-like n=1 Tax=Styela clava TaxID=7725 RepID=UPI00193A5F93|nr:chromatin assembly factor 1 subunit A-B-like [Styela clava]
MDETKSPGSVKKLKQAQLPFMVLRDKGNSPSIKQKEEKKNEAISILLSDDNAEKENISTPQTIAKKDIEKKIKTSDCESMIVDLTDETSRDSIPPTTQSNESNESKMPSTILKHIDDSIEAVVRRYSSEFHITGDGNVTPKDTASAKKRRRRSASLSPLPPDAKRPILGKESFVTPSKSENDDKLAGKSSKESTSHSKIPEIVITAATPPVGKQKNLASENASRKMHLEKMLNRDKDLTQVKKHSPLSAVLPKKRPRSRSPSPSRSNNQKVKVESKASTCVKIDLTKSTTPSKKSKQADEDECTVKIETAKHVTPVKEENIVKDGDKSSTETCQTPPPASTSMDSSQLDTPSPPEKPSNGSKITPGSKIARSLEAQRKKEEREKEREEKRKQREEQRLTKEKEKLEVKRKRDEEKAQKEEERKKKKEEEELIKAEKQKKIEEKRKEKEKLELEKKLEREKKEEEKRKEKERKEEEKRQKDEEKKQKEEEKRQKEEEKLQAEEEKRRKNEKRAESFKSFFKSPARSPSIKKESPQLTGVFPPFQLKKDMILAPITRMKIDSAQKAYLDDALVKQDFTSSYMKQFGKKYKRNMSMPTLPKLRRQLMSLSEDGLELVEDGESQPGAKILRAKFLLFHTNYRPPYFGTWRKESKNLSYKNPFKKDTDLFDYEFDSDDEWEDPGEGEDIDKSDDEDEEEKADEDEDDGFFVPHGYLSDDEGINEEAEDDGPRPDHKLKQKQLEFEASFKRKLSALTPVIIGCVWKDSKEAVDKVHRDILRSYKAEILSSTPIPIHRPNKKNAEKTSESPNEAGKSDKVKKYGLKAVPEEAMHDLIRLLHGNPLSLARLSQEFRVFWKLKNSEGEATEYGPMSLDESEDDIVMEENVEPMEVSPSEDKTSKLASVNEVDKTPTSSKIALDGGKTPIITPKSGENKDFEISKTQLLKRCKEIATYYKRDNINRACWFVHDHILDKYDVGSNKAPIPSKWRYATDVRKIQILIFPKSTGKPASTTESSATITHQSPGASIAKFVAKVSPDDILEQSKLKHEKAKQSTVSNNVPTANYPVVPSIAKYTTEKISPVVIIEKSAQKIAEAMAKCKEQHAAKVAQNTQQQTQPPMQEAIYVIPTPDAVKTFFGIDASLDKRPATSMDNTTDKENDGSD